MGENYVFYSLLAGDVRDLREWELEEDLLLVVHHVHAGPVHGDDDVVLGQVRTWKMKSMKI